MSALNTVSDTLPGLLTRNAANLAPKTAIREKRQGIWQATTWAEHAAITAAIARGLAGLGFRRGDRLAVLGDNRAALYRAQLAAMSLGGAAVPCWPDAEPDWLAEVLGDAGVSIVVVEDQDQVEKILAIKDRLPALQEIIYTDPRGVYHQDLAFIHPLTDVVASGEVASAGADATSPEEVALIFYLTPADGAARAVALTHAQLIAAATALTQADDIRPTDEYFAYLPMAWVAEALYGLALPLVVGYACSCPEDPETARRDLRELGPTILLAPPRIWNSFLADIDSKAAHATPLKRRLCKRFLPDAYAGGNLVPNGFLGEWLLSAPLRDQLGLGRLRWAHTGGLSIAPHVQAFFSALGVNLRQGINLLEQPGFAPLATDLPAPVQLTDGSIGDASEIEAVLCQNRYLADAVVIGGGASQLGALLAIDAVAVGDWAQGRGLAFTSAAELAALPDVRALVAGEVARANAGLPIARRIGRYLLLDTLPASLNAEASLSRIVQRRVAREWVAQQQIDLFADPPATGVEVVHETAASVREQAA